jgi:hypothetical protein
MRAWSEVDKRFIEIVVVYSGRHMPGVGEDPYWIGSGSLVGASRNGVGHGELLSPDDVRGKASSDVAFGFAVSGTVRRFR